MKYVGNAILTSPLNREVTFFSSSGEVAAGSANKSPTMIAREKDVFACNFEIFAKTSIKRPRTAPVTILKGNQHFTPFHVHMVFIISEVERRICIATQNQNSLRQKALRKKGQYLTRSR